MISCAKRIEERLKYYMKSSSRLGSHYCNMLRKTKRHELWHQKRHKLIELEKVKAYQAIQNPSHEQVLEIMWDIVEYTNAYKHSIEPAWILSLMLEDTDIITLGLVILSSTVHKIDINTSQQIIDYIETLWFKSQVHRPLILIILSNFNKLSIRKLLYSNFCIHLLTINYKFPLEVILEFSYALVNVTTHAETDDIDLLLNLGILGRVLFLISLKNEEILYNSLVSVINLIQNFDSIHKAELLSTEIIYTLKNLYTHNSQIIKIVELILRDLIN
jgi:hypothetical protein